ncbi:hypothetical protein AA0616_1313 [Komagataeibacter nataicola NRIC 0616]|nr:hypothetical protein AA0616_1313 [Komagataeibacter nataicola NRIC 0616]
MARYDNSKKQAMTGMRVFSTQGETVRRAGAKGRSGQEVMFDSKIIEVDGVFVGAAIITGLATSLRFYATHESVRSLHNAILPDLAALRHHVTATFRRMGRGRACLPRA